MGSEWSKEAAVGISRRTTISLALADHLQLSSEELFPRLELRRDLGLEPLDVVTFVLSLEEDDELAFPVEELEHVVTVGELTRLIADWLEERKRSDRRELALSGAAE
jgi:acyl carrier protein